MQESAILGEFLGAIHSRPNYTARGFTNVNCPACGDRRKRGGFAPTKTGGFRYFCYNGGCEFNSPTGWEPGNGLFGRIKTLFEMIGGNIRNIPLLELKRANSEAETRPDIVVSFPNVPPPSGAIPIRQALENKFFQRPANLVLNYLRTRGSIYLNEDYIDQFYWSPAFSKSVIIPFVHYDRNVGWLARSILPNIAHESRFTQSAAPDYLFNQYLLKADRTEHVLIVESPMSAIPLRAMATRRNTLSNKQRNLLRLSGKIPILIPDYKGKEWESFIEIAEEEGWHCAVPTWDHKDVGDAMRDLGALTVLKMIMDAASTNYGLHRAKLAMTVKRISDNG